MAIYNPFLAASYQDAPVSTALTPLGGLQTAPVTAGPNDGIYYDVFNPNPNVKPGSMIYAQPGPPASTAGREQIIAAIPEYVMHVNAYTAWEAEEDRREDLFRLDGGTYKRRLYPDLNEYDSQKIQLYRWGFIEAEGQPKKDLLTSSYANKGYVAAWTAAQERYGSAIVTPMRPDQAKVPPVVPPPPPATTPPPPPATTPPPPYNSGMDFAWPEGSNTPAPRDQPFLERAVAAGAPPATGAMPETTSATGAGKQSATSVTTSVPPTMPETTVTTSVPPTPGTTFNKAAPFQARQAAMAGVKSTAAVNGNPGVNLQQRVLNYTTQKKSQRLGDSGNRNRRVYPFAS